jgi:hypothetical protein
MEEESFSSMTRRAGLRWSDVPVCHHVMALRCCEIARRLPIKVKHLLGGRMFFSGFRWQSRQKDMLNGLACATSSILWISP